MLTFDQLNVLGDPIVELYERMHESVIRDIARRLSKLKISSAAWQVQRLIESGKVYEDVIKQLSQVSGQSEAELMKIFKMAGVKAMRFDDLIYKAAGLKPLPLNLSPAMLNVLMAGLNKTMGVIRNLTMTTAQAGQEAFIDAADLAYMQVSTGAMSYGQAIREAVKDVASKGLKVIHIGGRREQLDVAMRRTVLTGVNQTTGELSIERAEEMGQDLVAVSAHIGARNKGEGPANHESWQGKVYSRSGTNPKYGNFYEVTGYGTGEGLLGWNCRHSMYPFFEGISENAYSKAELDSYAAKTVTYNGQEMSFYDATQKQRAMEREIRKAKREEAALEAAGLDTSEESQRVRDLQAKMRDFTRQTGLQRQGERERTNELITDVLHGGESNMTVDPVETDRDMSLAKEGKLFDLNSKETEKIYTMPIDLTERYTNEELKADSIDLGMKQKLHILKAHPDHAKWLMINQDKILQAIKSPQIIDKIPRTEGSSGWNIAHIISIKEKDYRFLNVVLNFHNGDAKIWTMFLASSGYIYKADGNIKPRWQIVN